MAIRFFDMFAGIGGFRSGLEAVGGFQCVGYCEIDKYAKMAYDAIYDTKGELYYCISMTHEQSTQESCRISTLFAAASLVRVFQLLEDEAALMTPEALFSLRLPALPPLKDLHICSLKTYPDSYRMTAAGRLRPSSARFLSWGTMSRGRFLTARILESPSLERECILSDILESDVPDKYWLSQRQMEKLLYKSEEERRESESTPPMERQSR